MDAKSEKVIKALYKQLSSLTDAELLIIGVGFQAVGESSDIQYKGSRNNAIKNLIRSMFFDDRVEVAERLDKIIEESGLALKIRIRRTNEIEQKNDEQRSS